MDFCANVTIIALSFAIKNQDRYNNDIFIEIHDSLNDSCLKIELYTK